MSCVPERRAMLCERGLFWGTIIGAYYREFLHPLPIQNKHFINNNVPYHRAIILLFIWILLNNHL
jgi:hypothetical protein